MDIQCMESEYNILRAEMLQYMEEYQNLRNMMYVGTAALLGINTAASFSTYLYLMPLIIIIPSYILFYDYWKSVTVASVYMQVFLEKETALEGEYCHMWETRHSEFSCEIKIDENGKRISKWSHNLMWSGMNCHHIPYFLCSALCFILYFGDIIGRTMNSVTVEATENNYACFEWVLGVGLFVICCVVFYLFRAPDTEQITNVWLRIKNKHLNPVYGKNSESVVG